MPDGRADQASVVVVGGGFAGVACAKRLAKHGVAVSLIDRHDYNQFQPLLYQVATAQVETSDVARPLRAMFSKRHPVTVTMADIAEHRPGRRRRSPAPTASRSRATTSCSRPGTEPNFFHTPGAAEHAFPLYSVDDAERLRSRLLTVIEAAHRDPTLIDRGALNFVIVGAGATGVETAGALADCINRLIPKRVGRTARPRRRSTWSTRRRSCSHRSPTAPTSTRGRCSRSAASSSSWARRSTRCGRIASCCPTGARSSPGRSCGPAASRSRRSSRRSGLPTAPNGRIEVGPDLEVTGVPGVYALGDVANTLDGDGKPFPQLGSVALQAGRCAADNILADVAGQGARSRSATATRGSWR